MHMAKQKRRTGNRLWCTIVTRSGNTYEGYYYGHAGSGAIKVGGTIIQRDSIVSRTDVFK